MGIVRVKKHKQDCFRNEIGVFDNPLPQPSVSHHSLLIRENQKRLRVAIHWHLYSRSIDRQLRIRAHHLRDQDVILRDALVRKCETSPRPISMLAACKIRPISRVTILQNADVVAQLMSSKTNCLVIGIYLPHLRRNQKRIQRGQLLNIASLAFCAILECIHTRFFRSLGKGLPLTWAAKSGSHNRMWRFHKWHAENLRMIFIHDEKRLQPKELFNASSNTPRGNQSVASALRPRKSFAATASQQNHGASTQASVDFRNSSSTSKSSNIVTGGDSHFSATEHTGIQRSVVKPPR